MSTAAATASNDTKPTADPAPAPAAPAAPSPAPTPAPAAPTADPKPGTDPATPAADPAPDAGEDVDGDDSILDDIEDDAGEPAAKPEGEAPAEGDKPTEPDKDAAPISWAKQRDQVTDYYINKIEKKLSVGKDGKPLSPRQRQAAIDDAREKLNAKLARYSNLSEALLAGINAQDKISSGKVKAPLPDDPTDEELANWRKENGIPEDAKGYKLPKIQGQEWTEGDKPGVDMLLGRMHANNASQSQVDAVLTTYRELVSQAKEAQQEKIKGIDREDTQATRDALRDEFEGDFKPAMTLLKRLVGDAEVFPDDAGKLLSMARDPETGKRLINNPVFAKFLIDIARDRYGEGAMMTGDQQAAFNSEEQELVSLMKTDIDAYRHKPWKTTGMTASERYGEILRQKEARGRGRQAA